MLNIKKVRKNKLGFTLIELLIVIALLGTLAVALLAALDPFEQIKKGTDTGVRNTVSEIQSGAIRYAAIQGGLMPFSGTLAWAAIGTTNNTAGYTVVSKIIEVGELKNDFVTLAGNQLASIYLTGVNDSTSGVQKLAVCFNPISKSFKSDLNTKWVSAGNGLVSSTTCTNGTLVGGTNTPCYWCVQ